MVANVSQVDAIFSAAIEIASAEERAQYVRKASGEDVELCKRVEELLASHFAAGSFLESSPATVQWFKSEIIEEGPSSVIGPYKLLQQIGEGGMGVVFMAEQTEPVHRTVALKIVKPGMDTRQVIARFEAERQALALMDHSNIARVLDAGTTDTGRPYFVMDLVKGVPITQYCDGQHLSIRERLELMTQVCHAVQHAHQKGIIHRDIKPSNVLIAEYDGQPVPKIIDFGVAKATAQRLTEKTMFTEYGQLIGTFEYMSPEQARFNQLDVDTRSDIYSLGVLLYELLAGSTPLDRDRVRSAAFDEILRMIGEEEPPKPSTRLSSSQTLTEISAQRHVEPDKLTKLIRGDLDWIVMKCLEKDRNRRYETASALANDIARHLADEPVEARPATTLYRMRTFVRRNRAAVVAGSAVAAALIAGLSLASLGLVQARRQAEIARIEASKAEKMTQQATQVQDFLRNMLTSVNPESQVGAAFTVQQMMDRAGEKMDDAFNNQPEVSAVLHETMGETYYGLQLYSPAMKHFRAAVELRRRYIANEKLPLAMALMNLAKVELVTGTNLDDARANARESASILSTEVPESDWRRGYARSLEAILESNAAGEPSDQAWSMAVVTLLPLVTDDLLARMPAEFRDAMIVAKRVQREGDSAAAIVGLRRFYLTQSENMQKLAAAGDRAGLEQMLREYVTSLLDVPWLRQYLPLKVIARAQEYKAQGADPLIVEVILNGSIETGHQVWGEEHPHIAIALHELSMLLRDEDRLDEAETAAREALQMREKLLGKENPETEKSLELLRDILRSKGKSEGAELLGITKPPDSNDPVPPQAKPATQP